MKQIVQYIFYIKHLGFFAQCKTQVDIFSLKRQRHGHLLYNCKIYNSAEPSSSSPYPSNPLLLSFPPHTILKGAHVPNPLSYSSEQYLLFR